MIQKMLYLMVLLWEVMLTMMMDLDSPLSKPTDDIFIFLN